MIKRVTITEAQAKKINDLLASDAIESNDAPQVFVTDDGLDYLRNVIVTNHIKGASIARHEELIEQWAREAEINAENGFGTMVEIRAGKHRLGRDEQFYLPESCWRWEVSPELLSAAKNLAAV